MHEFGFRYGHLALSSIQGRLAGVHLRRGRHVFALRIVHFLLGDDAGLALEHFIQARVLQVQRFVLGLIALQFVFGRRTWFAAFLMSAWSLQLRL